MKKGVQKIQSMDADMWAIAWQDFCQEQPEKPLPAPGLPDSLTLLGMAVKDAFHLLEGDANMILKGYKPDIDAPSLIHVTVMKGGTAFIVGSFLLRLVRKFTTMAQFRKIETEGDMIWRNLDARQQKQLEAGESKTMYAWVIENKEVLHPPMTWKTEPWIVPAIFSILWLDFLKGVLCDGFHVGPLFDYSWGTISVSVTTTKYNIFLFYGILSMSYCNLSMDWCRTLCLPHWRMTARTEEICRRSATLSGTRSWMMGSFVEISHTHAHAHTHMHA